MGLSPPPLPAPLAIADAPKKKLRQRGPRESLVLVVAGIALLGSAAVLDARDRAEALWPGTVYAPEGEPPWEGAIEIRARWLPLINYPIRQELYTHLRRTIPHDQLRALGLERTERLIVVYAPAEQLEPLLASGRMPRPGRPEVLAGAYASLNEVHADDAHLVVVGRLKRDVAGLATAYLMPADEDWGPLFDRTATRGWLDPRGIEKLGLPENEKRIDKKQELSGDPAAASAAVSGLSIIGLALAAAGGAGLHRALFARMPRRGITAPARIAFGERPRLVRRMHTVMYGSFFFSMAAAIAWPQLNALAMEYVRQAFSEGSLSYVGDAYRSGNVLLAAAATWANNYLLQTVVLTVLASLAVPCLGILKTLASFVIAGVGMAPIWSGMPSRYSYHAITIILELEAYIYACAAVAVFWGQIVGAFRHGSLAPAKDALRILGSATALAGIMLAIAALYEATTLILLW